MLPSLRRTRESVAASAEPAVQRAGTTSDDDITASVDDSDNDETYTDCPDCNGEGMNNGDLCPNCGGSGRVLIDIDDGETRTREAETAAIAEHLDAQPRPTSLHVAPRRLREATKTADGVYEVVIIEEGMGDPGARNIYTAAALREAVDTGMFEGLRAYGDHTSKSEERDLPERSIRKLIGNYRNATFREVNGVGQVVADLHVIQGDSWQWARDLIESAIADRDAGIPPKVGISIDGGGIAEIGDGPDGEPAFLVQKFTYLPSADVVTTPGAGGGFLRRLTESLRGLGAPRPGDSTTPRPSQKETDMNPKDIARRLRESLTVLREKPEDADAVEAAINNLESATGDLDTIEIPTRETAAPARVTAPPETASDDERVVDLERRLREAETLAATEKQRADDLEGKLDRTDRVLLAARVLREAEVPADTSRFYFDEMVGSCTDEPSMKTFVQRKKDEEEAITRRVREAINGENRVEGAPPFVPAGSKADKAGGSEALSHAGIPVKAAAATEDDAE